MSALIKLNRRKLLTAGAGLVAAPSVLRRAYAADAFKIGKIGPVTGPIAGFGEATAWVVDGLKDVMAKLPVPVEIIQKDSQSNPNRAAEVATELIEKDGVRLLLAKGTPDTTNPVADQAELNGVPCITDDAPWQPYFFGRGGDPAKGFKWTYHAFWGLEDVIANFLSIWDSSGAAKVVGGLFPNDAGRSRSLSASQQ
jgi:branched-chain amino acid transport system substrate-binding protein